MDSIHEIKSKLRILHIIQAILCNRYLVVYLHFLIFTWFLYLKIEGYYTKIRIKEHREEIKRMGLR